MLNLLVNQKLKSLIVLFISLAIISSCGSTSSDMEKLKNADNTELIAMLQNGKLSERRQVSTILRNNVKLENIKAFGDILRDRIYSSFIVGFTFRQISGSILWVGLWHRMHNPTSCRDPP